MPRQCFVKGCLSKTQHHKKFSFHAFPKADDPVSASYRDKWLQFVGEENYNSTGTDNLICSGHFTEDQFRKHIYQRRLHERAVPTIPFNMCIEEPSNSTKTDIAKTVVKTSSNQDPSSSYVPQESQKTITSEEQPLLQQQKHNSKWGEAFEKSIKNYTLTKNASNKIEITLLTLPLTSPDENERHIIKITQLAASFYMHMKRYHKDVEIYFRSCYERIKNVDLCVSTAVSLCKIKNRLKLLHANVGNDFNEPDKIILSAYKLKIAFIEKKHADFSSLIRSLAINSSYFLSKNCKTEVEIFQIQQELKTQLQCCPAHIELAQDVHIMLDEIQDDTGKASKHLNLQNYKLFFLREYVKSLPVKKKVRHESKKHHQKVNLAIQMPAVVNNILINSPSIEPIASTTNYGMDMQPTEWMNEPETVKEYKLALNECGAIEQLPNDYLSYTEIKEEPNEPTMLMAIKNEPEDYEENDIVQPGPSVQGLPEIVSGFIIREIKNEEPEDF